MLIIVGACLIALLHAGFVFEFYVKFWKILRFILLIKQQNFIDKLTQFMHTHVS